MQDLVQFPIGWDQHYSEGKNGGTQQPPSVEYYMQRLCPKVVAHFQNFPSFSQLSPSTKTPGMKTPIYPFSTTEYLVRGVCTLQILQFVVASVLHTHRVYVYAGSHLGAILHGQPIPWDDDIDALMDLQDIQQLYPFCRGAAGYPIALGAGTTTTTRAAAAAAAAVTLHCVQGKNALKVYLQLQGVDTRKPTSNLVEHWSPFIDVFSYRFRQRRTTPDNNTTTTIVEETSPTGLTTEKGTWPFLSATYPVHDFFPTQPYYFGGIYLLGPARRISEQRYTMNTCQTGFWNHRLELPSVFPSSQYLDCHILQHQQHFPFVVQAGEGDGEDTTKKKTKRDDEITNRYYISNTQTNANDDAENKVFVYPEMGTILPATLHPIIEKTSLQQRQTWYNEIQLVAAASTTKSDNTDTGHAAEKEQKKDARTKGQILTDSLLPELDIIDVDNTIISDHNHRCSGKTTLRVVEYNAERGKWWLLSAQYLELLRQADIILLNEMDVGMSRTDQQHTARQMAYFLQMNYIWGIEFIELTHGINKEQQQQQQQYHHTTMDTDENTVKATQPLLDNFYGLHGNAILSRCGPIVDPVIFRDPLDDDYYSTTSTYKNAGGYERRLGGRMGLFGRIQIESDKNDGKAASAAADGTSMTTIVVGSIHKLGEQKTNIHHEQNLEKIQHYIGTSAVVIGGDQNNPEHLVRSFVGVDGLRVVQDRQNTWPASCDGYGTNRGDQILTNMKQAVDGGGSGTEPTTVLPCIRNYGVGINVGDHALISVVLQTPNS